MRSHALSYGGIVLGSPWRKKAIWLSKDKSGALGPMFGEEFYSQGQGPREVGGACIRGVFSPGVVRMKTYTQAHSVLVKRGLFPQGLPK